MNYTVHALNLAGDLDVCVYFNATSAPRRGSANAPARTVQVPYTITNEMSYLTFLHELGHVEDKNLTREGHDHYWAHPRNKIPYETFAWEWALRNTAFPLTVVGLRHATSLFQSYLREAALDTRDHPLVKKLTELALEAMLSGSVMPFPDHPRIAL